MKFAVAFITGLFLYLAITGFVSGNQRYNRDTLMPSLPSMDDIKNTFNVLPKEITDVLNLVSSNPLGVFADTIECVSKRVAKTDLCNFNTSFDPITYINECAKGTGLDTLVNGLQKLIPSIEIKGGVPEFYEQSRCFDPAKMLKPEVLVKGVKDTFGGSPSLPKLQPSL